MYVPQTSSVCKQWGRGIRDEMGAHDAGRPGSEVIITQSGGMFSIMRWVEERRINTRSALPFVKAPFYLLIFSFVREHTYFEQRFFTADVCVKLSESDLKPI